RVATAIVFERLNEVLHFTLLVVHERRDLHTEKIVRGRCEREVLDRQFLCPSGTSFWWQYCVEEKLEDVPVHTISIRLVYTSLMTKDLVQKKCVACEGDMPPLTKE